MAAYVLLLALSALISSIQAQNASSTYIEPEVPTGTPVPGDYSGPLRPQIHFSPPKDFMVSDAKDHTRVKFERLQHFFVARAYEDAR